MRLRSYEKCDEVALTTMLNAEGWPACEHAFRECPTVVWDDGAGVQGFFTIETVAGCLFLRHFYIEPGARNQHTARALLRNVVKLVADSGYLSMFINVKSERLARAVEYYFNARPLVRTENSVTYRVGFGG